MAKSNVEKETILARCEDYMLRGYQRPSELSQLLGVAYNTAKDYLEVVKKRWELVGTPEERLMARTELIKKTEEIIKESWILKADAENISEKVAALRTILQAIERLTKLQGLDSPLQLEEIRTMSLRLSSEHRAWEVAEEIRNLPEKERDKAMAVLWGMMKKRGIEPIEAVGIFGTPSGKSKV